MATRPTAKTRLKTSPAPIGGPSELLAIMAPVPSGELYKARLFSRTQDLLDEHNACEGVALAAHHVAAGRTVLFIGLDPAQVGTIGAVDTSGVTGSSSWSFSGTPTDDHEIIVECVSAADGAQIGDVADAIVIRASLDGGESWGRNIRLGSATSYLIPLTGITVAFSVGTIVPLDRASCRATSARYDATGLAAGFAALSNSTHNPRLTALCGDIDSDTELQDVCDAADAYEVKDRFTHVLCAVRDRQPDARLQKTRGFFGRNGTRVAITFDAAADTLTIAGASWTTDYGFAVGQSVEITLSGSNNGVKGVISALSSTVMTLPSSPGLANESNDGATIQILGVGPGDLDFLAGSVTRAVGQGSFITEGFKIGMYITISGTASNNGTFGPLTNVTATALTWTTGGASEANVSGALVTITGTERSTAWESAVGAIVGTTEQTRILGHRVSVWGGRAPALGVLDTARRARPAFWWASMRAMEHDIHIALNKKSLGPLAGVSLRAQDHDERITETLLALRIACLETDSELPGVYVSLPLTLDQDDAVYSRLHNGLVADLACRIVKRETTLILGGNYEIAASTGLILEKEARNIEGKIDSALRRVLRTPGREGVRLSELEIKMARDVDLRVQGTRIPFYLKLTHLGYVEGVDTTVYADVGG